MEMPEFLALNGREYAILRLLGKGKGGYTYLAERDGARYALKQIHHEPCDYYAFGDKLSAELGDYEMLSALGVPIPKLLDVDRERELLLKELLPGETVYQLVLRGGAGALAAGAGGGAVPRPAGGGVEHRLVPHQLHGPGRGALLRGLRVQPLHGAVEL